MKDNAHDPYAALRIPAFRLFAFGRMCAILGIQVQGVIVGWQIYKITNDPLALGLIGLAEAIPALGVALYAGHLVDISDRRRIILVCLTVLSACSAALLFLTTDLAVSFQYKIVWVIYGIIMVSGLARGFIGPALFSYLSQIVPQPLFMNSSTWNSSIWHFASMTGPAIGGLIYGFYNITYAYTADFCLMAVALGLFFMMESKGAPLLTHREEILHSLTAGLRFVFSRQLILAAITLDLFAVLFGGAVALIPEFAEKILMVGPIGFGWLNAAMDIGSVLVISTLTLWPMKNKQGYRLMYAVAGFGICIVIFGFSRLYWLSFMALMIAGMMDGISVIVRGTVLQLTTPDDKRGRVSSVNSMFINSSNELGQFESGFMARALGTVPSVIFGGAMTLLVVIITWFKAPELRKFEY